MAAKKASKKAEANTPNLGEILKWVARLLPVAVLLVAGIYVIQRAEDYLINEERFQLGAVDSYEGAIPVVRVSGIVNASEEQVMQVFAEDAGRSLYLFPVEERRRRLLAVNWVKDATVARIWPHRVEVTIREREPAAFVHLQSSKSRVALIDEDGVILDPPAQSSYDLPVLRGISEELTENLRATRVRRATGLMADLGPIANQISEIDVSAPDNLKVRQSIAGNAVLLVVGKKNFRRRIENFVAHFPEIQRRLPAATTFDLRLDDRITAVDGVEDGG